MCGVSGAFFGGTDWCRYKVTEMNNSQFHRGPDQEICMSTPFGAIGHTRLAINGLGIDGQQPMVSRSGRWLVAFNGEIYNSPSLKRKLRIVPPGATDGNVIPELLDVEGPQGLRQLRGMYAILAVDLWSQSLVLFSDPLGMKSLFWTRDSNRFIVASELRALVRVVGPKCPDPRAVSAFLHRGAIPWHLSGLEGVQRLEPGVCLSVTSGDEYAIPITLLPETSIDPDITWDSVASAFQTTVAQHMMSDVPVGILLSDGVDSALVADAASRIESDLTGVTLAMGGGRRDEALGASETARRYGLRHVVINREDLDFSPKDFFDHMQRPTVDGLNTYLVCTAVARSNLRVALSGIGADEVLTGYLSNRQKQLVGGSYRVRRMLHALSSVSHSSILPGYIGRQIGRWRSTDVVRAANRGDYLVGLLRQTVPWDTSLALTEVAPAHVKPLPIFPTIRGSVDQLLTKRQYEVYLTSQVLPDLDCFSMASSVEVRAPFVDLDFLSLLLSWSDRPSGKEWLVRSMDPNGGALQNAQMRPKQGFSVPMQDWMEGLFRPHIQDLDDSRAPIWGVVNPEVFRVEVRRNHFSRAPWYVRWSLVVLNEWLLRMSTA